MKTSLLLTALDALKEISEANPWTMEPGEVSLLRTRAFNSYVDLRSELLREHPTIELEEPL
jgi:hypothetical protein